MRAELTASLVWFATGCAIDLDPPEPVRERSGLPQMKSCTPESEALGQLSGRLSSARIGARTWVFGSSWAEPQGFGLELSGNPCTGDARALDATPFDWEPLGVQLGQVNIAPLAVVGEQPALAYFAAFPTTDLDAGAAGAGYGVARWDEARERFVGLALLWMLDRPSFGSAAVISDGYVYVYGGLGARFLDADIYVARAPLERAAEFAAYEYQQSGGGWQPSLDAASPMLTGGTAPSVAWHAARKRWLLAYTTPFSKNVTVRSGLGPDGPWSLPVELGRCVLPKLDADAFCSDVTLHASFFDESLALSHAVASWQRPSAARDSDYWTRWVNMKWPRSLP